MPRVLIAGFCALPGGNRASVQLRHVSRALTRQHQVDVLVLRRGDQAYVERFASGRLLRVPAPEGDFASRVGAFRRALARQVEGADYDIVHFRDGWSGVPVLEMRERLRFATIFDVTRSPMAEPLLLGREEIEQVRKDDQLCLAGADMILAPHQPARRFLAGRYGEEKVHVVPPGVNVDAFDWEERAAPTGPPRVLYLGSLAPGRGVRVLLRAWWDVSRQMDARLILAGRSSPEFTRSLQSAVEDLELQKSVDYLGEIDHDEAAALIAGATVCVAPGAVELGPEPVGLYPTKLLEYMACKRAVVAPARSTVTLLMRDEEHGLLFEPGQPAHLAQQILRVLKDERLRDRLAASAYQLVRSVHTASKSRRELRVAYDWLASRPQWRERFSLPSEAVAGASPPPPTLNGDVTVASDWDPTWMAEPRSDADGALLEYDDDVTDTRNVEEVAGDVTKVEQHPLGLPADEMRTEPIPAAAAGIAAGESWTAMEPREKRDTVQVADTFQDDDEDGTGVDLPASALTSTTNSTGTGTGKTPQLENRFVAGELEIPGPALGKEVAFTAVTPPLGLKPFEDADTDNPTVFVDESELIVEEDSKTTVSASPPPGPVPRPRGKRRGVTTPPPVPSDPPRSTRAAPVAPTLPRKNKPADDAR